MRFEGLRWKTLNLGDVTHEGNARRGDSDRSDLPVYGVDRHVGLTSEAKYVGKSLERYKVIEQGMFAYNPMRLNIGSIGYCSFKHAPGLVSPDYVVFGCDEELLIPDFLKWVIKGPEWVRWTTNAGVGSVRIRIYYKELAKLRLTIPPVAEQRAIAHVLGTLDDKIELNRRMNETLEAIARALFKSWFVDFDPVRAKAEKRQPAGMAAETAMLFPSSFEDSPLGLIPKGWQVGRVEDDFNITMGQSPPGSTYNEAGTGLPFFQGRADFGFRFPNPRVHCTAPTRLANAGDTLVSVRAPVGDINMATGSCCIGRGVAAVRHKTASRSYTYYAMQQLEDAFTRFESEGTVFGSINKKDFHSLSQIVPPSVLIEKFECVAFPLDRSIEVNEQQSGTITALRDSLLPRLLSGEIRVREAEREVGQVA